MKEEILLTILAAISWIIQKDVRLFNKVALHLFSLSNPKKESQKALFLSRYEWKVLKNWKFAYYKLFKNKVISIKIERRKKGRNLWIH